MSVTIDPEKLVLWAEASKPKPVAILDGHEFKLDDIFSALAILINGKWTSIKPSLKSIESPLLILDHQKLADDVSENSEITTKEAFIKYLVRVVVDLNLTDYQRRLLSTPIKYVRTTKNKPRTSIYEPCSACEGTGKIRKADIDG